MKRVDFVSRVGYTLVALFSMLGVYAAYRVYGNYPLVIQGFVGIAAIYFWFLYIFSPRKSEPQPSDLTFRFPKGFQYLIFAFIAAFILSGAGFQAIDMIWWIVCLINC